LKRSLAKPVQRKEPFDPIHVKLFFEILDENSVSDIRNTTIIVIAYYALLRFDELCKVRCNDLEFFEEYVEISIKRSKADQLRQGDTVLIARLGGTYCPVRLLEKYAELSGRYAISDSLDVYLFRRCISKGRNIVLTDKDISLTYGCVRELVKNKAVQIGLNPSQFSTHSMRSGGATAAANSEVAERALQRHGRWACSSSKDGYVKDKLQTRLSVSKAIARAGVSPTKKV
jgi:integrase